MEPKDEDEEKAGFRCDFSSVLLQDPVRVQVPVARYDMQIRRYADMQIYVCTQVAIPHLLNGSRCKPINPHQLDQKTDTRPPSLPTATRSQNNQPPPLLPR